MSTTRCNRPARQAYASGLIVPAASPAARRSRGGSPLARMLPVTPQASASSGTSFKVFCCPPRLRANPRPSGCVPVASPRVDPWACNWVCTKKTIASPRWRGGVRAPWRRILSSAGVASPRGEPDALERNRHRAGPPPECHLPVPLQPLRGMDASAVGARTGRHVACRHRHRGPGMDRAQPGHARARRLVCHARCAHGSGRPTRDARVPGAGR